MSYWDPLQSHDWGNEAPSHTTIVRLKKDILEIYRAPPPGVVILPNPDDITRLQAIVTGPFDTPYEGGFFLFYIRCPPNYPLKPPRVKLLTTGLGMVRFNPNFYKNGKVCLSILGTWSGPGWSPAQSLSSVLISIQSVMNESPYHNEPGFASERVAGDSMRYNDCIRHETIRVAVCDMAINNSLDTEVKKVVQSSFMEYYDYYVSTCKNLMKMDGRTMQDPFNQNTGHFRFGELLARLESIKQTLSNSPYVVPMETDEPGPSH
ncbi:ubiquitin-conjugating enzyme E2 Z-like [Styela clava]|uniref:ubiquitin-conjugating enzyme E2 Z-like n=1 Tax=Styela clava TaxID=7725 RepID=UPI0019396D3F|nr:ubiquitin-conjugating enzyme E2 Z-like [Styela clava]